MGDRKSDWNIIRLHCGTRDVSARARRISACADTKNAKPRDVTDKVFVKYRVS